ncbi:MAG: multicopper oxidase domain-containing protein [Bdellovibrionota bacterium]
MILKLLILLTTTCISMTALSYTPVETLGVPKLPYQLVDGVKVFQLTAEEVRTRFCELDSCKTIITWGYNGSMPGPTIEAVEGDHIKIEFKNNLQMPTAVHWHGLELPNGMDGGGAHTQG